MVIILNTDASAKNVGHIDLPYTPEVETTAYYNAIPNTVAGLSAAKKKAINNAFKAIKSNGFISKVPLLNIPLFGRIEGGVNLINPSQNIGFPTAGATYGANGVTFSLGWASTLIGNAQSYTMIFGNTTAAPITTTVQASMTLGTPFFGRLAVGGSRETGLITGANGILPNVINHKTSIGICMAVLDVPNQRTFVLADNELSAIVSLAGATINGANATLTLGGTTNGSNSLLAQYSHGIFGLGAALSPTEATLYSSILSTLMTALTAA